MNFAKGYPLKTLFSINVTISPPGGTGKPARPTVWVPSGVCYFFNPKGATKLIGSFPTYL